MQPKLLELNASEVVNVGGMSLHFLQLKLNFGLGNDLLFIGPDDARFLTESPRTAAPSRPDTEAKTIDGESLGGNDVDDTDKGLHPIKFTTDVFAKDASLQIWQHDFVFHLDQINPPAMSTSKAMPSTIR